MRDGNGRSGAGGRGRRGGGAARAGRGPQPYAGRHPGRGRTREPGLGGDQVEGRRAVRELLAAGRRPVRRLWLAEGQDPSTQLDEIEALASRRRVPVETVPKARLDAEARTEAPQGVLARARPIEPVALEELSAASGPIAPFLLVVCGVTDPHNLGSLLRSAEGAGVTGIVLPRHRTARLSPTVAKVAAGALEHLAFAVVGGIPAALRTLSAAGVWTVGLAGESRRSIYRLAVADGPVALVVGGEEHGLPPLVRRRCDDVVAIPHAGSLPSLNVGAAGAVACFEVARRRAAEPGPA